MPETNDWFFDIIWELSDRSYDAGMLALASKLEEAMDTYLAESDLAPRQIAFQSGRAQKEATLKKAAAREQALKDRRAALQTIRDKNQAVQAANTDNTVWHPVSGRFARMLA